MILSRKSLFVCSFVFIIGFILSFAISCKAGLDYGLDRVDGSIGGKSYYQSVWYPHLSKDKQDDASPNDYFVCTAEELTLGTYTDIGHILFQYGFASNGSSRHTDACVSTIKSKYKISGYIDENDDGTGTIYFVFKDSSGGVFNNNFNFDSDNDDICAEFVSRSTASSLSDYDNYYKAKVVSVGTTSLLDKIGISSVSKIIDFCDVPLFSKPSSAVRFIEDGILDKENCIYNPNMFQFSEQIRLDEFSVEVHRSNRVQDYFIRFYYKPSQFLIDNFGSCKCTWGYSIESVIASFGVLQGEDVNHFDLDFSKDHYDFYPYKHLTDGFDLATFFGKDINFPFKYLFSGKDGFGLIDTDDFSIEGVGLSDISKIDISEFDFHFKPEAQGVNGVDVKAFVDCLSGESSHNFQYPQLDGNGNFTDNYVDDPSSIVNNKQHYYIDVSKDKNGNYVYNYYFIDNKGLSTKVDDDSKPIIDSDSNITGNINVSGDIDMHHNGSIDVNIHGDSSGGAGGAGGTGSSNAPNLIIQDDDYSGNSLTDNITSIFGLRDDLETSAKDDGLFAFLRDFFAFIPFPLWGIVGFGMSTVCVIAIIRIAFKR